MLKSLYGIKLFLRNYHDVWRLVLRSYGALSYLASNETYSL